MPTPSPRSCNCYVARSQVSTLTGDADRSHRPPERQGSIWRRCQHAMENSIFVHAGLVAALLCAWRRGLPRILVDTDCYPTDTLEMLFRNSIPRP